MSALPASSVAPPDTHPTAASGGAGAVADAPRALLRIEGVVVLALSVAAYARFGGGWGLFALLFLAPDLSMVGYLANSRVGAATYNAVHSYTGPAVLAATGWLLGADLVGVALIWSAHIGFDRMLGYGLKYPTAFGDTHLGPIG